MTARQIIATLCRRYGSRLHVLPLLDGARVLWALAGCESDFGAAALPRHEEGYCYGHRYDVKALSRAWGCAAHCSYGPWQMMYSHLEDYLPSPLRTPVGLVYQPGDVSAKMRTANDYLCAAAVRFLNDEILGRQRATTMAQIAKAWNHGNWADDYDDSAYVNRALKFYDTPYPQSEDTPAAPVNQPSPQGQTTSGGASTEES